MSRMQKTHVRFCESKEARVAPHLLATRFVISESPSTYNRVLKEADIVFFKRKGFTLIEMLVVMAIIGTLVAVAFP